MSEISLMRQIQLRASKMGGRLFRNNVGFCECRGRKIRYGVGGKGWPDTLGWFPLLITQEMVGRTIAQFAGVEVKDGAPTTKDQVRVITGIIRAGGIGIIAHSVDDLHA